ncbi:MAG: FGGY family carbohydrate kinase, partial [Thermoplasmata archaeon]|nr:FGGY family carbohydrate kinase [Thermoplasmata archaeon]
MERYYLGFDAGTQSVKVAVYDADMQCVAQASNMTPISYPGPGLVEMSADDYLNLAVLGMRQCADAMMEQGRDPHAIRAIMGDGIICGTVGVNEQAKAVTPFINYLDSRTQADADRINAMGLDIWGRETGNADASCMFPALFARWFLRNSEPFRKEGVKFVHNAPYILMNLAGLGAEDAFIDQGTMSGWGLGFDVTEKEWSDRQLEILGIDRSLLPRVLKPWDVVGGLTQEMADRTGLKAGTLVCAGAGDTMQSILGCGAFEPGTAVDVAGTCAMFCMSTDGINDRLSVNGADLIFNSGSLDGSYFYWGFIR